MGFSASWCFAGSVNATLSDWATLAATSACTWNTSEMDASNDSCHLDAPLDTAISSGLTLMRPVPSLLLSQRTVPVSRYCTPSSCPSCWGDLSVLRYWPELLREVTWRLGRPVSRPRISSVIPSTK